MKKRLKQYRYIKAEIKELQLRVEELTLDIGIGAISCEEKGCPTNKISSATEIQGIALVEASNELNKLIREKAIEIERIENALSMLNEKERQAIELRYIHDYSLSTVCYKLDRSMNTVKAYIRTAFEKMEKLVN